MLTTAVMYLDPQATLSVITIFVSYLGVVEHVHLKVLWLKFEGSFQNECYDALAKYLSYG